MIVAHEGPGHEFPSGGLIVHDQDAHARRGPDVSGRDRRRGMGINSNRQVYIESRARPDAALCPEFAIVLSNDTLTDAEPETRPLSNILGGEEGLKDPPQDL